MEIIKGRLHTKATSIGFGKAGKSITFEKPYEPLSQDPAVKTYSHLSNLITGLPALCPITKDTEVVVAPRNGVPVLAREHTPDCINCRISPCLKSYPDSQLGKIVQPNS